MEVVHIFLLYLSHFSTPWKYLSLWDPGRPACIIPVVYFMRDKFFGSSGNSVLTIKSTSGSYMIGHAIPPPFPERSRKTPTKPRFGMCHRIFSTVALADINTLSGAAGFAPSELVH